MIQHLSWHMKFPFLNLLFPEVTSRKKSKSGQRLEKEIRQTKTLTLMVLATSIAMWSYAWLADVYIADRLSSRLGYALSVVHLFSPALLKFYPRRLTIAANFALTAGMLHVACFAYFTGGFNSNVLIWYAIFPSLAGLISGKKGAQIWCGIVCGISALFVVLELAGFAFPNQIGPQGDFFSHIFMIFGYIVISGMIITIFLTSREKNEKLLRQKNEKINNLLKILTHDVANSLNVIDTASTLFQKVDKDQRRIGFYFEKMDMASSCINEVITNIRTLHSAENGWEVMETKPTRLQETLDYCARMLDDKLKAKKLSLVFSPKDCGEMSVLVDPLFFKHHVLMNVLTNAIKFSEFGSSIEVSAKEMNGKVALVVKDFGVGISKEAMKHLFVEKSNKSTVGTGGERGSGFGMLITKSFVEKFEGKITVESVCKDDFNGKGKAPQSGTKVTLLLKGARTEPQA